MHCFEQQCPSQPLLMTFCHALSTSITVIVVQYTCPHGYFEDACLVRRPLNCTSTFDRAWVDRGCHWAPAPSACTVALSFLDRQKLPGLGRGQQVRRHRYTMMFLHSVSKLKLVLEMTAGGSELPAVPNRAYATFIGVLLIQSTLTQCTTS